MQNVIRVMDLIKVCFMCGEHMDKDNHNQWSCDCGIEVIENGCPDCDSDTYIDEHNVEKCVNCEFEDYTFCEAIR